MKKQHKALAALAVVIGMPLAFFLVGKTLPKRYTAEMGLLVDQSMQRAQLSDNPYQVFDDISEFDRPRSTQTQLDEITSTDVLQKAMEMGADKLPDKIRVDQDASEMYEDLRRRMTVDNQLNSDILTVRVTENDPQVAAELANDIGEAYQDYLRQNAKLGGSAELQALDKQISASQLSLTSMDGKIRDLKAKSDIFDVMQSGEAEAANHSAAEEKLAQVEGEYRGAVASLADAEAQLKTMHSMMATGQRDEVNPIRLTIEQSLTTEKAELADLRSHYYDDFPLVKSEQRRIRDLEQQLNSSNGEIKAEHYVAPNPVYQTQLENVQSLRASVASYQHQDQALSAEVAHSSEILSKIPGAEQQLQALTRNRTVAEQDYLALEQRKVILQSIGLARQPRADIVSHALPPSQPSFPDSRLLVMAGLALGVFFAVLIVMPRPQTETYVVDRTGLPEAPAYDPLAPRSPSPVRVETDDEHGG
jgi:succinoglycan biosynthesis transport protein ExoP